MAGTHGRDSAAEAVASGTKADMSRKNKKITKKKAIFLQRPATEKKCSRRKNADLRVGDATVPLPWRSEQCRPRDCGSCAHAPYDKLGATLVGGQQLLMTPFSCAGYTEQSFLLRVCSAQQRGQ
jgi:hypothetical protein